MFIFKEEKVDINGQEFTICELSAKKRRELTKYFDDTKDDLGWIAKIVKAGCKECYELSEDKIIDAPEQTLDILSRGILKLSGVNLPDEKEEGEEKN